MTRALRRLLFPNGWPTDPGLASLRLGARAAIAQPLVLAFALLVLRNPQSTLFAVFGVFALLVFGNFGGPVRSRAAGYAGAAVAGAALVALGTLASPLAWAAAAAALVLAFAIEFSAVFGGHVAGARAPLSLALVLAASVPAPAAAIPDRVEGWLIGGGAATVSALVLWPRYERDALVRATAKALNALAALIAAGRLASDPRPERANAGEAVDRLRIQRIQAASRPGGPSRRDRALVQLVTEVERAHYFATAPSGDTAGARPSLPEGDALAAAVVGVYEASAGVFDGRPGPDLPAFEAARLAHRTALDAWAASQLRSGESTESVLAGLDADHQLRVLSYLGLATGVNAAIAAGHDADLHGVRIPFEAPVRAGVGPALGRLGRVLRTHLTWTSALMHGAVRTALGLGLAVLIARLLGLDRAFWVVLGTTSVLRSNALATGRTAVQALVGTVLGFAVGGVLTLLFAKDIAVLWIALPFAVFMAVYAPSAVSFVAGQAAFTVLMLVLFNLLTPVGWRVGLVRIEDLLVGSAVGVAAGVLLWPRGARADFAAAVARLYRSVAVHLSEALGMVLAEGTPAAVNSSRAEVRRARARAAESFDELLRERTGEQPVADVAGQMLAGADQAVIVADTFQLVVEMGYRADACVEGAERLQAQGAALVASWFMLAERADGVRAVRTVPMRDDELREAALGCLDEWRREPSNSGRAAIALAWTREWLAQLDGLVRDLELPAAKIAAGAAAPWWR